MKIPKELSKGNSYYAFFFFLFQVQNTLNSFLSTPHYKHFSSVESEEQPLGIMKIPKELSKGNSYYISVNYFLIMISVPLYLKWKWCIIFELMNFVFLVIEFQGYRVW